MEGKVFAITGVSGIGLAVATQLANLGASIALADISSDALTTAVKELSAPSDRVLSTVIDVGDTAQVNAWVDSTVKRFGRLDGAANMAGAIGKHHGVRPLVEQDDEQWDLIFRVNVTGLMHCMRAQLRAMIAAGTRAGSIVNAASVQGTQGLPLHAAYSASKHAVIGLTRSAAKEVAKEGIRVNAVAPGATQTPLLDESIRIIGKSDEDNCLLGRTGTADEVANVVVFLLSEKAAYVTGSIYGVDGGWNC